MLNVHQMKDPSKKAEEAQDDVGSVFDMRPPSDKERIRVVTYEGFVKLGVDDLATPIVVQSIPALQAMSEKDDIFKKELRDTCASFKAHPDRASSQLKGDVIDPSLAASMKKIIGDMFPMLEQSRLPKGSPLEENLEKLLRPDFWVRSPGSVFCNLENSCLACLRYNVVGSRSVVTARFSELGAYVRAQKGPRALRMPINAAMTNAWLRSATPKALNAALDAGVRLYFGVVGHQEALFLPSGFVRCDKALPGEALAIDVAGVRVSLSFKKDPFVRADMLTAVADLLHSGRRNPLLDAMVKMKEVEEADAPTPKVADSKATEPAKLGDSDSGPHATTSDAPTTKGDNDNATKTEETKDVLATPTACGDNQQSAEHAAAPTRPEGAEEADDVVNSS